jgi:hypothetical protein
VVEKATHYQLVLEIPVEGHMQGLSIPHAAHEREIASDDSEIFRHHDPLEAIKPCGAHPSSQSLAM